MRKLEKQAAALQEVLHMIMHHKNNVVTMSDTPDTVMLACIKAKDKPKNQHAALSISENPVNVIACTF